MRGQAKAGPVQAGVPSKRSPVQGSSVGGALLRPWLWSQLTQGCAVEVVSWLEAWAHGRAAEVAEAKTRALGPRKHCTPCRSSTWSADTRSGVTRVGEG